MTNYMLKGNQLEHAVLAIENLILEKRLKKDPKQVKIENKHRRKINGVSYEVDIYVELMEPKGYGSIFIFECKNWSHRKIDRKEISDFIDKIEAFDAVKGFFIATNFTKNALEKAKEESRLEIITAVHDYAPLTELLQFEDIKERKAKCIFLEPGEKIETLKEVPEVFDKSGIIDGKEADLDKFINDKILCSIEEKMQALQKRLEPGINRFSLKKMIALKKNFYLQGKIINRLYLEVDFTIKAYVPKLHHTIEVSGRGSHSKIEAELVPGGEYIVVSPTVVYK